MFEVKSETSPADAGTAMASRKTTAIQEIIREGDGQVTLQAIDQPPAQFGTPLAVFQTVLEHEKKVTGLIYNLVAIANKENDYATQNLLVWFVLAMQCMSTIAIVRRETNSWRWPLFMLLYMNGLAYVVCLGIYQVGRAF